MYLEKKTKAAEVNPGEKSRKECVATSKTSRGKVEEVRVANDSRVEKRMNERDMRIR